MVGLPNGEKSSRKCVTVYMEYWRVTDEQTDILPQHSPRYAHASHGKNQRFLPTQSRLKPTTYGAKLGLKNQSPSMGYPSVKTA